MFPRDHYSFKAACAEEREGGFRGVGGLDAKADDEEIKCQLVAGKHSDGQDGVGVVRTDNSVDFEEGEDGGEVDEALAPANLLEPRPRVCARRKPGGGKAMWGKDERDTEKGTDEEGGRE